MPRPEREPLLPKRTWHFESCEERLALSAEPIADFWIEYGSDDAALQVENGLLLPLAIEGHGWTDVANAREQFGLRGSRQTVAIIDSGIAYDHIALGGGLGKAYRVVGGWDFAENDANPYDDGPAGFHGTHVAGIVGAADARYPGVAPDADLVALRVFDDQGNGYFNWVENALRWVHDHRLDYDNPITTVNLSLGTDWNSNTLPQWATLEEELKLLADDGIFVSVAAGNSFLVYNSAGLSYPAVSPHVTPVASVDASGNLSRFSQRHDRVLAAPGERVLSTLPDHFYGGDGIKNDWGATSGTSMASPYVAGASVLMREAMQNLGFTQVTQSMIYDRLRSSADLVYDAATGGTYRRVNLQRALDSLVGADDFGSTSATARAIGSLTSTLTVSGTIGRVTDQDFFRFTASQTGTATLKLQSSTHLAAAWQGGSSGSQLALNVVAGRTYTVGVVGGGTTIGSFTVDVSLATGGTNSSSGPASAGNWGTVEQLRRDNLDLRTSDTWFQVTAGRSGTFTVESFFAHSHGNVDLEVYDSQQRLIASSTGGGNGERIDFTASAGTVYYVRARGANSDVDFRLTNLLTTGAGTAHFAGTSAHDTFAWSAASRQATINGVTYVLAGVSNVYFDGGAGIDSATFVGSSAAEFATLWPGGASLVGGGITAAAWNSEFAHVVGDREDTAILHDSSGNEYFEAGLNHAWMKGDWFNSYAEGFGSVSAYSSGGWDFAQFVGSAADETLSIWGANRALVAGGATIVTEGFEKASFAGRGGYDTVDFHVTTKKSWLGGIGNFGWTSSAEGYVTEFYEVETLLANVRTNQKLGADLSAIDYVFRKIARS